VTSFLRAHRAAPSPSQMRWLLVAAAVVLRLPGLQRPLYLDEYATLEVLSQPTWTAAMTILRADTHLPGYFLCLMLWSKASMATPWLRLLSLCFDVGTLVCLGRLCQRWGAPTACWAIALWGANPIALRFSVEIRPYALLALLTLIGLWLACELIEQRRRAQVGALCVAWAALVATHPVGLMAVVASLGALALQLLLTPPAIPALSSLHTAQKWPTPTFSHFAQVVRRFFPLLPGTLTALFLFAGLHWGFTLDPSGARASWRPKMSGTLFSTILDNCMGTDAGAFVTRLGREGPAGVGLGPGLYLLALGAGLWRGLSRTWAAAALLHVVIVAAYSLVGTPVFWYRSIFPSLIFAAIASAIVLSQHKARWPAWVAVAMVTWQVSIWLPRASRAIDPTQQVAQAAVAAMQPGEAMCVFPDWMNQTVWPYLPTAMWPQISTCTKLPATPSLHRGVGIVRCNLDLLEGPSGLRAQFSAMRQHGVHLHDIFAFLDDDDDLYPAGRTRRLELLDAIKATAGPCEVDGIEERVAHLRCP
jgi:hypothetical protein